MKDHDENKESSYFKNRDLNNSYRRAMFQQLSLGNCKGIEGTSEFNEDFIKSYNDESDGICFLEVDVQYPKFLQSSLIDLLFLPERMKTEKVEKLVANLAHKKYPSLLCT